MRDDSPYLSWDDVGPGLVRIILSEERRKGVALESHTSARPSILMSPDSSSLGLLADHVPASGTRILVLIQLLPAYPAGGLFILLLTVHPFDPWSTVLVQRYINMTKSVLLVDYRILPFYHAMAPMIRCL